MMGWNANSQNMKNLNLRGPSMIRVSLRDLLSKPAHKLNILTYKDAVVAFIEILEVALHTILYIRQIYPAELFERRKKFEIPVFQCIDPSISSYISGATKAVAEEIIEDNVSRIIINIHDGDEPLENFTFSIDRVTGSGHPYSEPESLPLEVLQRQMRALLLKLNAIDAQLLPLNASESLSFSFIMQLRRENIHGFPEDEFDPDMSNKQTSEVHDQEKRPKVDVLGDPALIHIIRAGAFDVSIHVQESEAKGLSVQRRNGTEAEDSNEDASSEDLP
ncbi:hypothetical protein M0805_002570 [Coniferiporia weirii]|nr:hypothetical protein M0805_002570 [Coniferiporia weirii]